METNRPSLVEHESYFRSTFPVWSVCLILALIGMRTMLRSEPPRALNLVAPPLETPAEVAPVAVAAPAPAEPVPVLAEAPKLDRVAVARAESRLNAIKKERADAEGQLEALLKSVERLEQEAERDESLLLTLEEKANVVAHRIGFAKSEGSRVSGDRDRLRNEVATLAKVARPKVKALLDKSPVARPIKGDEVHFEVRAGRVTPIELDRLVEIVKADAKIRMKVGGVRSRPITATVGPLGAFALKYELGLMVANGGDDLGDMTTVGYGLRGWEVVPVSENRGETLEEVVRPGSDYAHAVLSLVPGKTSVTFWIYPDGFALYRRLRDDLHARGYLVAARPLPDGLPIQASPAGSASAAQ